jgi:hypothetical protein
VFRQGSVAGAVWDRGTTWDRGKGYMLLNSCTHNREPIAWELVTRQLGNLAWLKKSTRDIPEASGTFQELVQACIQAKQTQM